MNCEYKWYNSCKKNHYFLCGGVAVGKTTVMKELCNIIKTRVKTCFIKEYIDLDFMGESLLQRLKEGKMSNFEFQSYVLNCFETQLRSKEYSEAVIVVWERHPEEALKIFCSSPNALTISERYGLLEKLAKLKKTFDIPEISDDTSYLFKINTYYYGPRYIAESIYTQQMIPRIFDKGKSNYFYLLYCDPVEEQLKRIKTRGRKVEIATYKNVFDLAPINDAYEDLFDTVLFLKGQNEDGQAE
ncbi:hypothetical protein EDI_088270 [Entamoeba dispar SAW760]|uniref:Uncharacterized protein n=1 Tax=Entamoeba dispar (strain ATCC PRA-260 / SAW760) TaxID=370354 RepID=B0ESF6_ENTDS|nr:uncharacterized protein EDI_088270 [Entamoeba dispar SAW760]EDR22542.1 hypothetical protein EDI_088270 [Entamoeba dispar SAW760]|eukprot:EDR22542.1 hypothetical protein EDI_088270 [Entamoeba dispar SAW760]